jgi:hypothetical protein
MHPALVDEKGSFKIVLEVCKKVNDSLFSPPFTLKVYSVLRNKSTIPCVCADLLQLFMTRMEK